jgi:hypothetical protein
VSVRERVTDSSVIYGERQQCETASDRQQCERSSDKQPCDTLKAQ